MNRIVVLMLSATCLLTGCAEDKEETCVFVPKTSEADINIQFESLEDSLPAITTKAELVSFFSQHTTLRDYFFSRPAYPDDSVFINELFHRFTNPHLDTLLMETKKVFGDLTELKGEFRTAFANMKYYYPDFTPPKIITVITGLEGDLYVSDSLVIIGLDYFLGPNAKYKPNMYEYMLRRYQKNFIVPSVMLLYGIDDRFNKTNVDDKTVLADMIAFGKAYYFAKHMMPCTADSIFIAYTQEEINGSRKNEGLIWYRFIEDQVLYETGHQVKQKYIDERPKTIEVGEKCPGRIGTWIGWEIVKTYMKRYPETTLPQLMLIQSADKIFKDSKYKPDLPKGNVTKDLKPGA
ncbi:MAG: gliding motility lipoprotein GldB [Bacteroidia bacterium]|nr:gliding motility lipoprotein GldB [Bacteroidia bacterium]